ncbi:methionyl-tRNA formyltransferase [Halobacterium jilantaiense]|uniref:Methionyl-tRNA formyltransferase n=1 Tax=Halobacterium jilantaiense TaxID=355548 RepID=A0A1I0MTP8_9EURY|nr:formyltransferase family protein [Halobacterium jilantaiense]SEV91642.1 methionyl-tRNA formyltransferase [Halobacterium jilantaiense]
MPSVAVLGMNRFGEQVYNYLIEHEDTTVLGAFTEPSQYECIEKLEPDFLVSAGFDHIIPPEVLQIPDSGAINLHPSYLPHNKGVNPDVWSIIEDRPAGVSIHYMTPEVDAGDLIARERVDVEPSDTGRSLRKRLDRRIVELFEESWEDIYNETVQAEPQDYEKGNINTSDEFGAVCELNLSEEARIGDVIDTLRALTFPPYYNAYFEQDGERYYVRVSIEPESEISTQDQEWDTPTLF